MAKQNTGIQQGEYMSFLNSVPTVGELDYIPSFVAEDLDLKYVDKNQDDFLKILDKQRDDAKKGFDAITEAQDKILKLRADNPYQSQTIENLKAGSGFDNTLFDLKEEDFENPFKVKEIESRAARMLTSPDYLNILRDQTYHDTFNKELDSNVCAGKNANSALCKMGREELKKYLSDEAGAYRGGELRAADFTPLDWMKVLKDDLDKVPVESFMGDVMDGNGYLMVEQLERRGKELVSSLIKNRTNDKQFANNLYADGFINEASVEKLKQDLVNAWTQNTVKKFEFKLKPRPAQAPVWQQKAAAQQGVLAQLGQGTGYMQRVSNSLAALRNAPDLKTPEQLNLLQTAEKDLFDIGTALDKFDTNKGEVFAQQVLSATSNAEPQKIIDKVKTEMAKEVLKYGDVVALHHLDPYLKMEGENANEIRKALDNVKSATPESLSAIAETNPKLKSIYRQVKGISNNAQDQYRIMWNLMMTANGQQIPTGNAPQQPVQVAPTKTPKGKNGVNF